MRHRSLVTGIACLLGVAGNIVCVARHDCMAGHMQHPPYGVLDYALDFSWYLALLIAAWLSRESNIKRKKIYFYLCVVLIPTRFFASDILRPRFPPEIFDFLVLIYLGSISIKTIWRALRMSTATTVQKEQNT